MLQKHNYKVRYSILLIFCYVLMYLNLMATQDIGLSVVLIGIELIVLSLILKLMKLYMISHIVQLIIFSFYITLAMFFLLSYLAK